MGLGGQEELVTLKVNRIIRLIGTDAKNLIIFFLMLHIPFFMIDASFNVWFTCFKPKSALRTHISILLNFQVRLMISDTARHKLLVLSGQSSENTGELILQSGSFSFCTFIDIFTDQEASKHV